MRKVRGQSGRAQQPVTRRAQPWPGCGQRPQALLRLQRRLCEQRRRRRRCGGSGGRGRVGRPGVQRRWRGRADGGGEVGQGRLQHAQHARAPPRRVATRARALGRRRRHEHTQLVQLELPRRLRAVGARREAWVQPARRQALLHWRGGGGPRARPAQLLPLLLRRHRCALCGLGRQVRVGIGKLPVRQ
ncbi:hypothetical protein T492DRAFT_1028449 [Pavlovales sp. CCMP2436]|nr:hypothetical protein T492DRAFT_1028449 [Pavlovales sp. CCMP2436]